MTMNPASYSMPLVWKVMHLDAMLQKEPARKSKAGIPIPCSWKSRKDTISLGRGLGNTSLTNQGPRGSPRGYYLDRPWDGP